MKKYILTLIPNINNEKFKILLIIIFFIILIIGIIIGFLIRKIYLKIKEKIIINNILKKQNKSKKIIQSLKENTIIEINKIKKDIYLEIEYKKKKNLEYEKKLKEKEKIIASQSQNNYNQNQNLKKLKSEYNKKFNQIIAELEKISGISIIEAKEELFNKLKEKLSLEFNKIIKNHEYNIKNHSKELANNIVSEAIERYASNFIIDNSVSYIKLPNEEMKGRIIGKDGRNIKSFELTAGVDIIIDEKPATIKISSFNPIRREIATRALEDLIKDGIIHPIKIEEILKFHEKELNKNLQIEAKKIINELKLTGFKSELISYIGKLKYRTSYGQNVLLHSFEVAKLAGVMAAELGLDINIAKRAGLLHDIGKAADYELEGSHVYNGVIMAKKYGESDIIINAIHSHHGDVSKNNVYSSLVSAADTLSAARPGSRNNSLANFITRIKEIEDLCTSIKGVKKAYAVKSGRQIRIIVDPKIINDFDTHILAKKIKQKIKKIITISGDIHITVIRELRATEIIN